MIAGVAPLGGLTEGSALLAGNFAKDLLMRIMNRRQLPKVEFHERQSHNLAALKSE